MQFDSKVRQIKDAGGTLAEIDIICHLLLTMPDSYDNLIVSIESMDPIKLTLDYVKGRLLDETNKRKAGKFNTKSSGVHAMSANITCYWCGKADHMKSQCKFRKGKYAKKGTTNQKNIDSTSKKDGAIAKSATANNVEAFTLCAFVEQDVIGSVMEEAHTCMHENKEDMKQYDAKQNKVHFGFRSIGAHGQ